MTEKILLSEAAYAVWKAVKESGTVDLNEIVRSTGIDHAQVAATATEAAEGGYFEIEEHERQELVVSDGAAALLAQGLPERLAIRQLEGAGDTAMPAFVDWSKNAAVALNEVFKWGGARGWIERTKRPEGVLITLTAAGRNACHAPDDDERALQIAIDRGGRRFLDELATEGIDAARIRTLLATRSELARIKPRTQRLVRLTEAGRNAFASRVEAVIERNALTPEDIESGAWRHITLRRYDVGLPGPAIYPAKIHPLRRIIEETRRSFLEMGFTECVSPMVESAFWNFDALFQPQDHPARDMQDTFYMRNPAEAPLPEERIVEPVRRTHENGWTTGSEGWGYTWDPQRSRQVVLRTHTTAATIRALAANPDPPQKFFCVGWAYRNETVSFKHLPVFHQVDGIIIDEDANLASLMGTLQEFYSKMGFGRVKFKPAFYPYTEPSVDVVVYMESRGKWLEMGGAGIFRPEVTLPLGCRWPVLAWGLGVERLAMLRFGFSDLRDLYRTGIEALEEVPLCR